MHIFCTRCRAHLNQFLACFIPGAATSAQGDSIGIPRQFWKRLEKPGLGQGVSTDRDVLWARLLWELGFALGAGTVDALTQKNNLEFCWGVKQATGLKQATGKALRSVQSHWVTQGWEVKK